MIGYVIFLSADERHSKLNQTYKAFNVVECPEFRKFLLYIGDGKIVDKDIPHRTKVTNMIHEEYKNEYQMLKGDLTVRCVPINHFLMLTCYGPGY
jgi:hypothetical protein